MADGLYKLFMGGWPSQHFPRLVSDAVSAPFVGTVSGEVAITKRGMPLGVVRYPCRVVAVNVSVLNSGKDDSSVPSCQVDVKINGTSCLTTLPIVAHVSGEAAQQKTTISGAADTGVTEAVINQAANSGSAGDVLTWDLIYTGNASPTSKAHNLIVIVEFDPVADID